MIRTDPIAAGERDLEAPTKAGAVDRRHHRHAERLETTEQLLSRAAQALGVGGGS
jgi:hypothetical protein